MLDDDYDILHGHGFEYVIHDIDQILENGGLWYYIMAAQIVLKNL